MPQASQSVRRHVEHYSQGKHNLWSWIRTYRVNPITFKTRISHRTVHKCWRVCKDCEGISCSGAIICPTFIKKISSGVTHPKTPIEWNKAWRSVDSKPNSTPSGQHDDLAGQNLKINTVTHDCENGFCDKNNVMLVSSFGFMQCFSPKELSYTPIAKDELAAASSDAWKIITHDKTPDKASLQSHTVSTWMGAVFRRVYHLSM